MKSPNRLSTMYFLGSILCLNLGVSGCAEHSATEAEGLHSRSVRPTTADSSSPSPIQTASFVLSSETDRNRKNGTNPNADPIAMKPIHTVYTTTDPKFNPKLDKPLADLGPELAQYRLLRERKIADTIFDVEQTRNDFQQALEDYSVAREVLQQGEMDLCRFRGDYASWLVNHNLFPQMPQLTDGSYGQAFDLRGFMSEMQFAERHLNAARFSLFLEQRRETYWSEKDSGHNAWHDFQRTLPSASRHLSTALSDTLVGNWRIKSSAPQANLIDPTASIDALEASTSSLEPDGLKELQHYFILHIDPKGLITAEQFYSIFGHTYALACPIGAVSLADDGTSNFKPSQASFSVDVLKAGTSSVSLTPVSSDAEDAYIKTLPIVRAARENLAKLLNKSFPAVTLDSQWKWTMTDQETFELSTGDSFPSYELSRLYFADDSAKCSCPRIP